MFTTTFASAALTAVLLGCGEQPYQPLKSGPPVGSPNNRNGFRPQFVTGPGEQRCPV